MGSVASPPGRQRPKLPPLAQHVPDLEYLLIDVEMGSKLTAMLPPRNWSREDFSALEMIVNRYRHYQLENAYRHPRKSERKLRQTVVSEVEKLLAGLDRLEHEGLAELASVARALDERRQPDGLLVTWIDRLATHLADASHSTLGEITDHLVRLQGLKTRDFQSNGYVSLWPIDGNLAGGALDIRKLAVALRDRAALQASSLAAQRGDRDLGITVGSFLDDLLDWLEWMGIPPSGYRETLNEGVLPRQRAFLVELLKFIRKSLPEDVTTRYPHLIPVDLGWKFRIGIACRKPSKSEAAPPSP